MDFNKLKELGKGYVEKGKAAALNLTERGVTEAKILNNQARLAKAQRQLGALVYSLAKGGEENQPLVDKYVDAISAIEQEIDQLKATLTPAEAAKVEEESAPAVKGCPQCGAQVDDDALFCNKCGAQL
ncbi:MAG: zinc-ribbon domain-containing protein [Faecalibacterium sp.]|nr:zinc-ribbon domain-containing protein [Faecalibacterium sp.]